MEDDGDMESQMLHCACTLRNPRLRIPPELASLADVALWRRRRASAGSFAPACFRAVHRLVVCVTGMDF